MSDSEEESPVRRHRRYVAKAFARGPEEKGPYKHGLTIFLGWTIGWLGFWLWIGYTFSQGDLFLALMAGFMIWAIFLFFFGSLFWYEFMGTKR